MMKRTLPGTACVVFAILHLASTSMPSLAGTSLKRRPGNAVMELARDRTHAESVNEAMNIVEAEIGVSRSSGGSGLYDFFISVNGRNIASITANTPSHGPARVLHKWDPEPDAEWSYYRQGYSGLCGAASISQDVGFGDFILTFTGRDGSVQTATVPFDPGCTDFHTGFANITFPGNGQTGVILDPTFTWACTNTDCGNFAWYMELFDTADRSVGYEANLDRTATAWTPGVLSASTWYGFWIAAGSLLDGTPRTLRTDPGLDEFVYVAGFETGNEITFETQSSSKPGRVLDSLRLERTSSTELTLAWSASTCAGLDYSLYRGVIGSWYSHTLIDCHDDGDDLTEAVAMPAGNAYFLVAPSNAGTEGSYGRNSSGVERPRAVPPCQAVQSLSCP